MFYKNIALNELSTILLISCYNYTNKNKLGHFWRISIHWYSLQHNDGKHHGTNHTICDESFSYIILTSIMQSRVQGPTYDLGGVCKFIVGQWNTVNAIPSNRKSDMETFSLLLLVEGLYNDFP